MNTFQLSCFLAVAESLNFARAAEKLNITQPAVTHQIHSLESELNVKLFRRTTRIVALTQEGRAFLPDARNILAISNRAIKRFEEPPEHEIQVFSIGCHNYMPLFLLPEILRKLQEICPYLHPRLLTVPFQQLYRLLDDEDVDVILGFSDTRTRRPHGTYRELKKIPISCVCSADSPLAQRTSVRLSDFKEERLILNAPEKSPEQVTRLQALLTAGHPTSDFYFCDSFEAAGILVEAGYGVSVLPDLFIPPKPGLIRIPLKDAEPLSFGLYYKNLQHNEPLKHFIRLMKNDIETIYNQENKNRS